VVEHAGPDHNNSAKVIGEAMNSTTQAIAMRRLKSKMSRCRYVATRVGTVKARTAAARPRTLHSWPGSGVREDWGGDDVKASDERRESRRPQGPGEVGASGGWGDEHDCSDDSGCDRGDDGRRHQQPVATNCSPGCAGFFHDHLRLTRTGTGSGASGSVMDASPVRPQL
jgi:hypothetical protein